jgi:hypothetical protein
MYPGLGHLSLAPVSTGTSTEEPVSVASLLAHLRLGSSSEASAADLVLVAEKIPTARRTVENRTERSLLRNQFDQAIERFPCDGGPSAAALAAGVGGVGDVVRDRRAGRRS